MVLTRSGIADPSNAPEAHQSSAQVAEEHVALSLASGLAHVPPDASPSGLAFVPPGAPPPLAAGLSGAPSPTTLPAQLPFVMTDQQLAHILQLVRSPVPAPAPFAGAASANFAACSSRFDGARESDVGAFIDAIEIYKECVSMEDHIALRGLPMLLTSLAATWWHGVKSSVTSWSEAITLLRHTYGPRLPPHRIYREIFKHEQGVECTDIFVSKIRALMAQLPPHALSEEVQLDMVYGLLSKRIREKVCRLSVNTFSELLTKARRVEDIFEEGRDSRKSVIETRPVEVARVPVATTSTAVPSNSKPRCNYCRQFGHSKEECMKLSRKVKTETETEFRPTVTCFGCGAPGVIRTNCPTCKEKKNVTASSSTFHAIAAVSNDLIDARERPVIEIKIYSAVGKVLLDTGAKQSIASESLHKVLIENNHKFEKVETNVKLADGTTRDLRVDVATVNVMVHGLVVPTVFVVLPGAKESLLGTNFIKDAGMVLDFNNSVYSFARLSESFKLEYEQRVGRLTCSAIELRADESSNLSFAQRDQLSKFLEGNEDIFEPGGAPTTFAVHLTDTGTQHTISVPPYRVSPQKKMMRKARDRVSYMGHIISAEGIKPDPNKISALQEIKPPANLKELRTFLQTCSCFRKFIPRFSDIARPLTELIKKNCSWKWENQQIRAFEELKSKLSSAPVLRQADFSEPFVLRSDASPFALGAVLLQGSSTEERPIEYASRLLTSAERNYTTTEREALAVVWALERFRGYVQGAQIKVATDHQPLKWLLSLKTPSGRLARWAMKIQAFNLNIEYAPGKITVIADTLSRPPGEELICNQQQRRKVYADKGRRPPPTYKLGDLVLVASHSTSSADKGVTQKFAPRRIGPFRIAEVVSPTSFKISDSTGNVSKYHVSALTPYHGNTDVARRKWKGRPSAKSSSEPSPDLEGETIAREPRPRANESARYPRARRIPVRYQ